MKRKCLFIRQTVDRLCEIELLSLKQPPPPPSPPWLWFLVRVTGIGAENYRRLISQFTNKTFTAILVDSRLGTEAE